jgi:hypothetical protein
VEKEIILGVEKVLAIAVTVVMALEDLMELGMKFEQQDSTCSLKSYVYADEYIFDQDTGTGRGNADSSGDLHGTGRGNGSGSSFIDGHGSGFACGQGCLDGTWFQPSRLSWW